MRVARAMLHPWEEPMISGQNGSGAIFFCGCSLRCCYCQNYPISHQRLCGQVVDANALAKICLDLQAQGAHNINLVNPMHYAPGVAKALCIAKNNGLSIPVVCNTSGYDLPSTIDILQQYVDIWLPDFKYLWAGNAGAYSGAEDYGARAQAAIAHMVHLAGSPVFGSDGMLSGGVWVRHLLLPGARKEAMAILDCIHRLCGSGGVGLSIMRQYTPCYKAAAHPAINRRVTTFEYQSVLEHALKLGFRHVLGQSANSATMDYTPSFQNGIEL